MGIDDSVRSFSDSLQRYLWHGVSELKEPDGLRPLEDVKTFVLESWRSKLSMTSETAYGGSKLFDSILEGTGRRYSDDLDEANEVFKAGRAFSKYLWGLLDDSGEEGFTKKIEEITGYVSERFSEWQKRSQQG